MAAKLTLNGGIALVTGAASGIGKDTATAFAEAGTRGVVFADLNEKGAQEAAEQSKKYAANNEFRPLAIHKMVDTTTKEFGRIDSSVNSAGVSRLIGNLSLATTPNLNTEFFMKLMEINAKGTMLCIRAVTKAMAQQEPLTNTTARGGTRSLGRGSIVNLGSINGYIAIDCAKDHIRVNAVCPSWVDTPMMQASLQRVPQLGQIIQSVSPLGRAATVEEVADYIVFLCSPSATYINGTGLCIDAGITVTSHAA
ncbi:NAD(P)-binding protein [Hypoxylon sp. FL1284]|nr:NAD(P)-binding protein [Hypoxylon sp. FL1284]